jgi:hypothetical protein
MTKRDKRAEGPARPIRTKRDFDGATAVVKSMSGQTDRDTAAELRLKSLLQELDKFDDPEDDMSTDFPEDSGFSGPRRRWSDDFAGFD